MAWHRLGETAQAETPPEHAALIVGVGLGKTRAARIAAARFVADAEDSAPGRVLWLVPTHKLGDETLAAMNELGVRAAVMRGRNAKAPGGGEAMCLDLPAVDDALKIHEDVEASVCGSPKNGMVCGSYELCQYQRQKRALDNADVIIAAHQSLFQRLPRQASDGVGLIIVDESFWQAGLSPNRAVTVATFADEPLQFPVLTPGKIGFVQKTAEAETNDLHALSAMAQAVFDATPDGALVSREAVIAAGITADDCALAYGLEWKRKVEGVIHPGMAPHARKEAMRKAAGNQSIPRRAGIWRALGEMIDGTATHTGRLELATRGDAESARRVVLLHSRSEVREKWLATPILTMDATMQPEIVRHFLPRLEVLADVQATAPHMEVTQVVGGWGKTSLITSGRTSNAENARRVGLVAELADFARFHGGGNALVVTYQAIEDRFAAPGVRTGHFNNIAGLDVFGDVRSLFVIGRPLPDAAELRTLAMALTGLPAPEEVAHTEARGALMADGTGLGVNVRAYADPTLEALRAAITDAEIIQAIGRGRGVNRTAETPLAVFVLADVVLPLPVARVVRWADVRPDVVTRMLARGVALLSPADAARGYPDLFPTDDAARMALKRVGDRRDLANIPLWSIFIGECSGNTPAGVSYRPAGRGQQTRRALVTPAALSEVETWLTSMLGKLADFRITRAPAVPLAEFTPATAPAEVPPDQREPIAAFDTIGPDTMPPFDAPPPPAIPTLALLAADGAATPRERLTDLSARLDRLRPPSRWGDGSDALRLAHWHARLTADRGGRTIGVAA